jgi:hypothetical protein
MWLAIVRLRRALAILAELLQPKSKVDREKKHEQRKMDSIDCRVLRPD